MRSMSFTVAVALSILACGLRAAAASAPDMTAAAVLQKTSERYKNLRTYDIQAETQISVAYRSGVANASESVRLAVGTNGAFRVERHGNGESEVIVSDGKITWRALPDKKIWSKQEVAQITDVDDESDDEPSSFAAQDLFSQTQRSLVSRYVGLNRYANAVELEKPEKVKINGAKVPCYVIRLAIKGSNHKLFITADTFLVARHVEIESKNTGEVQFSTEYKSISLDTPAPDLFEFQPSSGSKEVATILLPSEHNMSLVGKTAIDFTLKSLDGTPVHLADLRGKVVLLDFWATWCPPCRHELPTIESISKKYSDRNVVVFGVNDEETSTARRFLEKNHPDLQTLHDGGGKVHRTYGCHAIPTVLIINPEGTIVAHFVGERSQTELLAALKDAGMK
jgi:peroxiredoxin/outer membrane lipoprotein-sorting protein